MRNLRKCPKYLPRVDAQGNVTRCKGFVIIGFQLGQPAEGVDDLRIGLVGIVGEFAERCLCRPRIQEAGIDAVGIATKATRQEIGLKSTDHSDEKVRQDHWWSAETFDNKAIAVPALEPETPI